jgi:murein DD-endopeptidase MepM/ murein hydrolase activator NlpD
VRFHYGVDLEGEYGIIITATAPGYVALAGWNGSHGRRVVLDHAAGFRSSYSHLSQVLVHPGAYIRRGQAIGRLGNSGRSTGPHLHFELTRYGNYLDPLDHLGHETPLD